MSRPMPAAQLVKTLAEELHATLPDLLLQRTR
jgi:hypothetical protein